MTTSLLFAILYIEREQLIKGSFIRIAAREKNRKGEKMKAANKRKAAAAKILRRHALLVGGRILYIKPLTDAAVAAGVVEAAEAYTGKMHCIRERPAQGTGIWDGPTRRLGVERFSNGPSRVEKRVDVDVRNPEDRKSTFERVYPIRLQYGFGKGRLNLGLSVDETLELIEGLTAAVNTVAEETK